MLQQFSVGIVGCLEIRRVNLILRQLILKLKADYVLFVVVVSGHGSTGCALLLLVAFLSDVDVQRLAGLLLGIIRQFHRIILARDGEIDDCVLVSLLLEQGRL